MADRLLFFVGVGGIIVDGALPALVRASPCSSGRSLVAGATLALAALGARRIDVTWFGKAGTFGLMVAFPLFLASHSTLGWADTAEVLAWVAGIPGLVLSYISLVHVRAPRPRGAAGPVERTVRPG